ncbi:MAG TPA: glycosyltransferase [Nitrospira sp.]|nr:glycosyltransferase [Nitrospira sp.]
MFVLNRRSKDPHVTAFDASMDWSSRIKRRVRRERIARDFGRYNKTRPSGFEIFSDDRSEFGLDLVKHLPSCDIVNLHWVARYVDYESFFPSITARMPVVWRIADMNPITGGCHVDEGCSRFLSGCGSCPQLGSAEKEDLSAEIWKRKQSTFAQIDPRRLHLVALNRWMEANLARHPFLGRFPVSIIPNGIDTELFAPRDRRFAREVLGLPQDVAIVLFVADVIQVRYKGFALLTEALSGLVGEDNVLLLSIGSKPVLHVKIPHAHLGYITDDRVMVLAYNAADLFVVPALYDNSPNTVLEAMACGIPVVAFETGGIPDMVRHNVTGLLAPHGHVEALQKAIKDLLRHPERRRTMGSKGREIALQEYSVSRQCSRYAELYKSLL